MKTNSIKVFFLTALLALAGCDDFLDTLPDNRAELNSTANITNLLVSAYPTVSFATLCELASDNIKDNGVKYGTLTQNCEEAYRWKESTQNGADTPSHVWEACYQAIASANQVLEAIEKSDNPASLSAQKGEALLCRAYGHFILVNIFCQAYNEQTSTKDMGIPYITACENVVLRHYDRGTVAEVYDKIAKDIQEGLPLISDAIYTVPKYHFNKRAAYAFAARFYLFHRDYENVVLSATETLGDDPVSVLRDYTPYDALPSYYEIGNQYVKATENANLLLTTAVSIFARGTGVRTEYRRYGHPISKAVETLLSAGLWGNQYSLNYYSKLFGSNEYGLVFPKFIEFFEYTDKVNKIGLPHIVTTAFTTDETLLCRAEAYVYLNQIDKAVADIQSWMDTHHPGTIVTSANIVTMYNSLNTLIVKELHPKFEIGNSEHLALINCILHLRRIETIYEGLRWFDIKRYGIVVTHNVDGEKDDVLEEDDPRRAFQLPIDVITAGQTANPR